MKSVLLLGDSIRMGYQDIVKKLLKDDCQVMFPEENSRFVQYNFNQLKQMVKAYGHFDVICFNSGYWDMNVELPKNIHFNDIPEYTKGLKMIVDYIKEQNSIPIFANNVPIYSDGYSNDNTGTGASITYRNKWVIEYNEAAEKLMKQNNVQVVDLYSAIVKGEKYYKCPDMLHLSDEGNHICGTLIANTIKEYIVWLIEIILEI